MAETRISAAQYTAMDSIDQTSETKTDFRRTVDTETQDYPGTRFYPDWKKWFGYYKNIPEVQAVINKKAIWILGKGYETDEKTKAILDKVVGWGKDSFHDIMFNMVVTAITCGDSFAEIVKNSRGKITNIKPINPGSMVIYSNKYGVVEKYIQVVVYTDEKGSRKKKNIEFKPKKIFHLCWNRLGDEPHGRSTIEKLVNIIDAVNEGVKDLRIVFHRYVKPLLVTEVDEDDEDTITAFKAKLDKAVENMENLIIPKGTATMERMSIPQYSTLDPLPWLNWLQKYFVIAEGVPDVVMGWGQETTEASSKILYLAWQQNIEHHQRWLEAQSKAQLGLDLNYNFPASIAPELMADQGKGRDMSNMEMSKDVGRSKPRGQGIGPGRAGREGK